MWLKDILLLISPMGKKFIIHDFLFFFSGLDNAGKTTILKKLASEDVTHITPTQVSLHLL